MSFWPPPGNLTHQMESSLELSGLDTAAQNRFRGLLEAFSVSGFFLSVKHLTVSLT